MMAVGMAATTAPAMTTFQSTENEPDRLFSATVTGCAAGLDTTVIPNKKSFQIFVNWKIPTTTNAGGANGSMTCRNVPTTPAPSIFAASMISVGIAEK